MKRERTKCYERRLVVGADCTRFLLPPSIGVNDSSRRAFAGKVREISSNRSRHETVRIDREPNGNACACSRPRGRNSLLIFAVAAATEKRRLRGELDGERGVDGVSYRTEERTGFAMTAGRLEVRRKNALFRAALPADEESAPRLRTS